jgi:hypothetical protein
MLFPASKIWPTAIWTSGSRGFRNAPCWAWAIASSQRLGSRAGRRAEHGERLAGSSGRRRWPSSPPLPRRPRRRRRAGPRRAWYERGGAWDRARGPCGTRLRLLRARSGEERLAARQVGKSAVGPACTALSAVARAVTPSLTRAWARARAACALTLAGAALTASSAWVSASAGAPKRSWPESAASASAFTSGVAEAESSTALAKLVWASSGEARRFADAPGHVGLGGVGLLRHLLDGLDGPPRAALLRQGLRLGDGVVQLLVRARGCGHERRGQDQDRLSHQASPSGKNTHYTVAHGSASGWSRPHVL